MPEQRDAGGRVVAQVDVVAAANPGHQRIRPLPRLWTLVARLAERADPLHPPEHVAAAVAARITPVAAHREGYGAARGEQILHDLAAGGAGAADEHRARGELRRVAVPARVHLEDARRKRVTERRHDRLLVGTGGDDDVGGLDRPLRGLEPESAGLRADAVHAHAGSHRRGDELLIPLDEGDDLAARGEAVRLAP